MRISDFDYPLPPEFIAQTPVEPRDASRLLVLGRAGDRLEHRRFRDLPDYLRPGDLLILNQTRVLPARLYARKAPSGGKAELLLLKRLGPQTWEALAGGKGVRAGTRLRVEGGPGAQV
ncbi:MAG: S-adenosylmethionine:tRNA ribosyltransferase-isomerase, partial [Chloroflexi bacterium]|nr:S-adenosylmethionine:tRNA ribosyltransferase-isomerase [Chloroflexota bacterium]